VLHDKKKKCSVYTNEKCKVHFDSDIRIFVLVSGYPSTRIDLTAPKEKTIGCCSKLDGKIWHSIFNWLQQLIKNTVPYLTI